MSENLRDSSRTKQKLIDAVGEILIKEGFLNLGINNVARKAGVSKILIYRYFDDLDSLLAEFLSQRDYWVATTETAPIAAVTTRKELQIWATTLFKKFLRHLLENPELQEIHRWELLERNPMTELMANQRGRFGISTTNDAAKFLEMPADDLDTLMSIFVGGILYLVLRSKTIDNYNSLDFRDGEVWKRLEKAIDIFFEILISEKSAD